jgi:hypothetical protein
MLLALNRELETPYEIKNGVVNGTEKAYRWSPHITAGEQASVRCVNFVVS